MPGRVMGVRMAWNGGVSKRVWAGPKTQNPAEAGFWDDDTI